MESIDTFIYIEVFELDMFGYTSDDISNATVSSIRRILKR